MKTLITIDPSIQDRHHAYVVWDCEPIKPIPIQREALVYPAGLKKSYRLGYLREWASDIVKAHKPDKIVIEGQYRRTGAYRRNISDQAVIQLAKAAGVWEQLSIPYEIIPPDMWLRHFGKWSWGMNDGQSPSGRIMESYVNHRLKELGLPPEPNEHVRCALLIGFYYFEREDK